jgi:hypothetical protein
MDGNFGMTSFWVWKRRKCPSKIKKKKNLKGWNDIVFVGFNKKPFSLPPCYFCNHGPSGLQK